MESQNFTFDFAQFFYMLTGTYDLTLVVATSFLWVLGAFLFYAVKVVDGIQKNENTPNKFSASYFIKDQKWILFLNIGFSYSVLRFFSEKAISFFNAVHLNPAGSMLLLGGLLGFTSTIVSYKILSAVLKKAEGKASTIIE